jgi:hypothetical protein
MTVTDIDLTCQQYWPTYMYVVTAVQQFLPLVYSNSNTILRSHIAFVSLHTLPQNSLVKKSTTCQLGRWCCPKVVMLSQSHF